MNKVVSVCLHFAPVQRKRGCDLNKGRVAPRDCLCDAYEPDIMASAESGLEEERTRFDAWNNFLSEIKK